MTVKGRFTTSRIRVSAIRVGTVLYHGGAVTAVERTSEGWVITSQWGPRLYTDGAYRLTFYPRMRRTV
jgi:hypothetical protein